MWLKDHSALKQILCVILTHWGFRASVLHQTWIAGLQPLPKPVSLGWDPRICTSNTSSSGIHKILTQGPYVRNMPSAINSEQKPWVHDWHRLGLPLCERHLFLQNSILFQVKGQKKEGQIVSEVQLTLIYFLFPLSEEAVVYFVPFLIKEWLTLLHLSVTLR